MPLVTNIARYRNLQPGQKLPATAWDNAMDTLETAVNTLEAGVAAAVPLAQKGAANGIAPLDAGQKIPQSNLPDYAKDYDQILRDQTNALISGTALGTEGKWRMAFAGTLTPNQTMISPRSYGNVTTVFDSGQVSGFGFGSLDRIYVSLAMTIVGDSGATYNVSYTQLASPGTAVRYVDIHPKHGDVRSDFTSGNTYPVFVFQESTAPADRQTGDLDVVEYFVGNNKTSVADINAITGGVGSYATLNAGYWNGKTWQSQLLGSAITVTGGVWLDLNRKSLGAGATMASSVQVRNASGAWVTFTYSPAPFAQYTYYTHDSRNRIMISTADSWGALGYSSEADMLANSAVKVTYKTKARRLRPIENPAYIRTIGTVLYSNDHYIVNGSVLNYETTGNVSRSGTQPNMFFFVPLSSWNLTPPYRFGQWNYPVSHAVIPLGSATSPVGYKALFALYSSGGTLRIAVWSKELIFDVDWGDDGEIPIGDNVTTVLDDNGNVVIRGCYSYDTGIPA